MWFDVDKDGLSKLLERRGKSWVVFELAQNSWDESNVSRVDINLEPIPGRPFCNLSVLDDSPEGFRDLSHAYVLFAESYKKGNSEQRGRFNLGEKLVLALCESATISSTTGTVSFDKDGRHNHPRKKRETGTLFEAVIKMTREEYEEVCKEVRRLLPPSSVETTFNGGVLPKRPPIAITHAVLPTEVAGSDGILRRSKRNVRVDIYETLSDETAYVYEMGIPVVETGDRYHVDIQQKVPLNLERSELPEAFLRDVRAIVLNCTASLLTKEEAASTWVGDALEDESIAPEAVNKAMELRYGEKRVIYDPSDREANSLAVSRGYTVIPGGSFSSQQWANIKSAGAALPAGQVTPSPKPFSPDGKPLKTLDSSEYKPHHIRLEQFAQWLAIHTIGRHIGVVFANDPKWKFAGAFGPTGPLYINALEHIFSEQMLAVIVIDFLIHEFGHDKADDHLSSKYHAALTRIGAIAAVALQQEPEKLKLLMGD